MFHLLVEEIAEDEKNMELIPMPFTSSSPIKTYNISNATAYARKWAKGFNPKYKKQKRQNIYADNENPQGR